jgi:hypothetical protein
MMPYLALPRVEAWIAGANTVRLPPENSGRRGRNRTCNPRIRNPVLYPLELRALRDLPAFSLIGSVAVAIFYGDRRFEVIITILAGPVSVFVWGWGADRRLLRPRA